MKFSRCIRQRLTGLLIVAMLAPSLAQASESPAGGSWTAALEAATLRDLKLDAAQELQGMVVDPAGQPVAEAEVHALLGAERVATATTDAAGRFRVRLARGGVHQFQVDDSVFACRVWSAAAAPPAAATQLLLVTGDTTERGQRPLGEALLSRPVLIAAIIAAAIAIPIAVHNRKKDSPSGS